MESKSNRKLYPKSVLTLYLKLYCKRSDSTQNKMIEGIQSWLTLSEAEKEQFYIKYRECHTNYKNKLATYLKKTHPFMKKKKATRSTEGFKTKEHVIETEQEATKEKISESEDGPMETEDVSYNDDEIRIDKTVCNNEITNSYDQSQPMTSLCRDSSDEGYVGPLLTEPVPPNIKNARQLYEMLNVHDEHNVEKWSSLSSTQKSRYRRVVLLLKNDYITKFKAYLESLPPEDLFDYYNNFSV